MGKRSKVVQDEKGAPDFEQGPETDPGPGGETGGPEPSQPVTGIQEPGPGPMPQESAAPTATAPEPALVRMHAPRYRRRRLDLTLPDGGTLSVDIDPDGYLNVPSEHVKRFLDHGMASVVENE